MQLSAEHKAKLLEGRARALAAKKTPEKSPIPTEETPQVLEGDVPSVDPLSERVDNLSKTVDKLVDLVANLVAIKPTVAIEANQTTTNSLASSLDNISTRIPKKWREIIDNYLGVDFEAKIEDSAGGSFSMLLVFPQHIDRRTGDERRVGTRDLSMASPIHRSSDVSDVEKWCKAIAGNILKTYPNFIPKKI